MSVAATTGGSVWIETGPAQPSFPPLGADVHADVVVIGGGIVGITTALLAQEAGRRRRAARGQPPRARRDRPHDREGHLAARHDLRQLALELRRGRRAHLRPGQRGGARAGSPTGCSATASTATSGAARPTRTSPRSPRSPTCEDEVRAAVAAGLPATYVESTPLPYPVAAAVRFDDQAEFHVRKYLLGLVDRLVAGSCLIFEHSHAVDVDTDEDCVVKTPGGRVIAKQAVVATHYPFLDRSLAFARVHPQRSYAIACRIDGAPPEGMFISSDSPTRTVRAVPVDGEELLIVGGEGHRTGTGGDTAERYRRLEAFAREHWNVRSVEHRWSAQDNTTLDGLPYVGALTPTADRVFMATGFAKWGMTGGTAAAALLCDLLMARDNASAGLFDPNRLNVRASATSFVKENAVAGLRFVGDRVMHPGAPADRRPAARRGRDRPPARRGRRRLPRRRRRAARGLADLHAPRLPRELQQRRAQLGLPLPRLALHARRRRAAGPGGAPAGAQAAADADAVLRGLPQRGDRGQPAGVLRRADRLRAPAGVAGRGEGGRGPRARRARARQRRRVRRRRARARPSATPCARSTTSRTGSAASTSAATSATSAASGASSRSATAARAPSSTCASIRAASCRASCAPRSPTP